MPSALGSRARELLRLSLAAHCRLDPLRVGIERVRPPTATRLGLGVEVHLQVGADVRAASQLAQAVKVGERWVDVAAACQGS